MIRNSHKIVKCSLKSQISKDSLGFNACLYDFLANMTIGLAFNEIDLFTHRGVPSSLVFSIVFYAKKVVQLANFKILRVHQDSSVMIIDVSILMIVDS